MAKGANDPARKTYLDALKEARQSGADDYEAADIAEKETKRKHGRLPKEDTKKGFWG